MKRFPAFATALVVHAAVFATLIVLPVFIPEPLPDPGGSPPLMPAWPLHPRIALADADPPAAAPRAAGPRRLVARATPLADEGTSAAPVFDRDGPPTNRIAEGPIDTAPFSTSQGDGAPVTCCGPSTGGSGDAARAGVEPGDGTLRIGEGVRPPTKLHHVAPHYPELALRARLSGTVEIDCLIDQTGRVTEVRVLAGHPLLAPAAALAVGQWVYSPTRLNGEPVAVRLTVSVRFEVRT